MKAFATKHFAAKYFVLCALAAWSCSTAKKSAAPVVLTGFVHAVPTLAASGTSGGTSGGGASSTGNPFTSASSSGGSSGTASASSSNSSSTGGAPANAAVADVRLTPQGTLAGQGDWQTETDAGGAYSFSNVPLGDYVVTASMPSTVEGQVTALVTVAGTTAAPELVLTPAGSISGVITVSGVPTGGVEVSLDDTSFVTSTDADGAFTLSALPTGTYAVRAEKIDVAGGRLLRNVEVYYAQTTTILTLDITPGVSADFNHPPVFAAQQIAVTPYQPQPGTNVQPLPLDLQANEVERYDTIALQATASDPDGDSITYFWSADAGTLDRTDQDTVHWTVDSADASEATIAVRVTDDRSGASQLTSEMSIADVQTLSGDQNGASAVYGYRRFGGAFRILLFDLASEALTNVADVDSLDDVQPIFVGSYVHYVADANGATQHYFVIPGETPSLRSPSGDETGVNGGGNLVQSKIVGGVRVGWSYNPSTDTQGQLFDCGGDNCGNVTSSDGTNVAFVNRSNDNTIYLYDTSQGALATHETTAQVSSAVLAAEGHVLLTDAGPGEERGAPNNVLLQTMPGSLVQIYEGAYDVFLGGFDGDVFGFTEQAYREISAPETAYFFRISTSTKSPADSDLGENTLFAYDRTLTIVQSHALVRRYPRADWLKEDNLTHYQLGMVVVP